MGIISRLVLGLKFRARVFYEENRKGRSVFGIKGFLGVKGVKNMKVFSLKNGSGPFFVKRFKLLKTSANFCLLVSSEAWGLYGLCF